MLSIKKFSGPALAPLFIFFFAVYLTLGAGIPKAEAWTTNCPGVHQCKSTGCASVAWTADTATDYVWGCQGGGGGCGQYFVYECSAPKVIYSQPYYQGYYQSSYYSQPAYYSQPYYQAYYQASYYSQPYYQGGYYAQSYYQSYYQGYYQGYYQASYYGQAYYQGYYQASYYSQGYYQPYYQAAYYSQGYYQGYYQSYYQGYYQSYYQAYYQPYYQPAYYSQPYYQPAYAPSVSWSPASVTIGEGDVAPTFGYNSSGASGGCMYEHIAPTYALDWSFDVTKTSMSWSLLHYLDSWSARATCKNGAGQTSSNFAVSVQKNGAATVSVTGPTHVTQGGTLNLAVTMQNSGAKSWDNGTTPHELCVATSTQADWGAHCFPVTSTTNSGATFTFNVSLTSPSVSGDYPLSFNMCEEGLINSAGNPYANGTCRSGVNGYLFGAPAIPPGGSGMCDDTSSCPVPPGRIRVKNPTLAVTPPSITFSSTYAAGDPALTVPVTIGNSGAGTLAAGTIGVYTGPFSGTPSFSALTTGQTTSANVNFQSNATGTWNSSIDVKSGVQVKNIPLIAYAIDMLTVGPSSLVDFGEATNAVGSYRRLTLKNNSTQNNSGPMNVAFSGTNAGNFSCFPSCSPSNIPSGQSKTVTLKFTPAFIPAGGATTTYNGVVTFTFPLRSKSLPVTLTGVGVPVKIQFKEK